MKLCLFCKTFQFFEGYPDLSDVTPGDSGGIGCGRYIWDVDTMRDTEQDYRKGLENAQTCKFFDPRPEYRETDVDHEADLEEAKREYDGLA